jgi:phenylacetic acid degradation operon negative regulatory protein
MPGPTLDQRPSPEQPVHASARSLLFTILGELVHPDPRPVWTASLLYVLKAAGFSEQASRQAIARGAAAGWMASERRGREVRLSLTPELNRRFDEGERRVFAYSSAESAPWDGRWLVLMISIPNEHRTVRKRLYSALQWAGLGNPTPGVWLTPHTQRADEIARVVADAGLRESTLSVVGEPAAIGLSEAEVVRRSWDLTSVAASYEDLRARFRDLKPEPGDPALLAHLDLAGALRHFPFVDPQLPEALLPRWVGRDVTRWSQELSRDWSEAAHARWRAIVEATSPR